VKSEVDKLYRLIVAVRLAFNRLKSIAEELHRDLGITVAMRGILEALSDDGAQTVPAIARKKGVSRQHIQVNVDALLAAGLVELQDNATHRRSPLVLLTAKGRKTFLEVRRREAGILADLAGGLGARALEDAARVLEALNARLTQREEKDDEDDE